MTRGWAVLFAATGALWAVTAWFLPAWWASPAFGRTGLNLNVMGLLWAYSSAVLGTFATQQPLRLPVVVSGVVAYAWPTVACGVSIVWFTVEENNVAAIGSAVAWLGLGLSAATRLVDLLRLASAFRAGE